QILEVLMHARTIVENAFVDPFLEEQLVVGVCEPVRFIANSLQQMQRARIRRQLQRHGATRSINFFMLFREYDDWQIVQAELLQFTTRRGELTLAAIDNDQIWQTNRNEIERLLLNSVQSVDRLLLRKFRRVRICFARLEQNS